MNNIPEFSVTEISNLTKNILEENFFESESPPIRNLIDEDFLDKDEYAFEFEENMNMKNTLDIDTLEKRLQARQK